MAFSIGALERFCVRTGPTAVVLALLWVTFCPFFPRVKLWLAQFLQSNPHHRLATLGLLTGIIVLVLLQNYGNFLRRVLRLWRHRCPNLPRIPEALHNLLWSASAGIAVGAFAHHPHVVLMEAVVAFVKLALHTPVGVCCFLAVPVLTHVLRNAARGIRSHPSQSLRRGLVLATVAVAVLR